MRLNRSGWLAPLLAAGSLWLLAGCGGSGGNDKLLVSPSPAPCNSSVTGSPFSMSGTYTAIISYGTQVSWTPVCSVRTADIVEYHIMRDGVLIGFAARSQSNFFDSNTPFAIDYPLTAQSLSLVLPATDPPVYTLTTQTLPYAPYDASPSISHVYTVSAIIGQTLNNQRVYEERIVGVSGSVPSRP